MKSESSPQKVPKRPEDGEATFLEEDAEQRYPVFDPNQHEDEQEGKQKSNEVNCPHSHFHPLLGAVLNLLLGAVLATLPPSLLLGHDSTGGCQP